MHTPAVSDEVVEVEFEDRAADERFDLATSMGCVQRIGDHRRGDGLVCLGLKSRFGGHNDHETVPQGTTEQLDVAPPGNSPHCRT